MDYLSDFYSYKSISQPGRSTRVMVEIGTIYVLNCSEYVNDSIDALNIMEALDALSYALLTPICRLISPILISDNI